MKRIILNASDTGTNSMLYSDTGGWYPLTLSSNFTAGKKHARLEREGTSLGGGIDAGGGGGGYPLQLYARIALAAC